MAPLLIAHRAGNDLKLLSQAFAAGVDYAEADVWLYRKRLEVRHDKTAGLLPLLWDRWSLLPGWKPRLVLSQVVRAAAGRGKLYLDLKGEEQALPAVLTAELKLMGVSGMSFSSPVWWYLDELKPEFPEAVLFYTISSHERLEEFRPRLSRREISAVAINNEVVSKDVISELHDAGVEDITTWGVDTREDAQKAFASGLNGITSKNLALLAELRIEGGR
jgi:glycerophosphoryl diester phosphodiesterase